MFDGVSDLVDLPVGKLWLPYIPRWWWIRDVSKATADVTCCPSEVLLDALESLESVSEKICVEIDVVS